VSLGAEVTEGETLGYEADGGVGVGDGHPPGAPSDGPDRANGRGGCCGALWRGGTEGVGDGADAVPKAPDDPGGRTGSTSRRPAGALPAGADDDGTAAPRGAGCGA
jgi:hypothetical protein